MVWADLIVGPFSGPIMERFGVFRGVALSSLGVAITLVLMGAAPSPFWFTVGNFLMGATSIITWTGLSTLAVNLAPQHRGTASSLFGSARFLAMAISPIWFTTLYQRVSMPSIFLSRRSRLHC